MEWVRGVSLRMAYEIRCGEELVATAATEHAMVDLDGRPRRIPAERRALLLQRVGATPGLTGRYRRSKPGSTRPNIDRSCVSDHSVARWMASSASPCPDQCERTTSGCT